MSSLLPTHNGALLPVFGNHSFLTFGFCLEDTARIFAVIYAHHGQAYSLLKFLQNPGHIEGTPPAIVIAGRPLEDDMVDRLSELLPRKPTVVNVYWLWDSATAGQMLPLTLERSGELKSPPEDSLFDSIFFFFSTYLVSGRYHLETFLARKLFTGCVFTILQYLDEEIIELSKRMVIDGGGEVLDHYDPEKTTHLILQYSFGQEYENAMSRKIPVATLHWLHECHRRKRLMDPAEKILNAPFPRDPVPGAAEMVVSVTGYTGIARMDIMDMVTVMGSVFTKTFSQDNTHLIALSKTGQKYEKAKEWGIPVVNHHWLHEILIHWKIQSVNNRAFTQFYDSLADEVGRVPSPFALGDDERVFETPRTQDLKFSPLGQTQGSQRKRRISSPPPVPSPPPPVLLALPAPPITQTPESGSKRKRAKITTPSKDAEPQEETAVFPEIVQVSTIKSPDSGKGDKKRRMKVTPKVLFTGVSTKEVAALSGKIESLGGEMVTSIADCTHLVANKANRTAKFLSGICICDYIVSLDWVHKSKEKGRLLDPEDFLLVDEENEERYQFSLAESMKRAKQRKILDGKKILLGPSVKKGASKDVYSEIIVSAGGCLVSDLKSVKDFENVLGLVSKDQDSDWVKGMGGKYPQLQFYDQELLLLGILRQKLDFDSYRIVP